MEKDSRLKKGGGPRRGFTITRGQRRARRTTARTPPGILTGQGPGFPLPSGVDGARARSAIRLRPAPLRGRAIRAQNKGIADRP
jgi:hypothetical protein